MGVSHASFLIGCSVPRSKVVKGKGLEPCCDLPEDNPSIKKSMKELGIDYLIDDGKGHFVVGLKVCSLELDFGKHTIPHSTAFVANGKKIPSLMEHLAKTKDALERMGWWNEKTFGIWAWGSCL